MGLGSFIKKVAGFVAPLALPGVGTAISVAGGLLQRADNKSASAKQMAFQERMSGTAHQREVQDLAAAGLNPILSARYGGSSTPPGASMASPNVAEGIPQAITARAVARRTEAEIANLETMATLNAERLNTEKAQQGLLYSNSALAQANAAKVGLESDFLDSTMLDRVLKTTYESVAAGHNVPVAAAASQAAMLEGEVTRSGVGHVMAYLNRMGISGKDGLDLLKMFVRTRKSRGEKSPGLDSLIEKW